MAQLQGAFDATQFDPTQSAGQLPVSDSQGHKVRVTDSEIKPTKAGDGGMLVLTLEIVEGPHKGATGPYRLNIYNANQTARDIAQKQLSAVCHVTGVMQLQDSSQLHNIPFRAIVGKQKPDENGNESAYTEIKKVLGVNGNEPGKGGGSTGGAPAPAPNAPAPQPAQPPQQPQSEGQAPWGQPAQTQPQQPTQDQSNWQQGNAPVNPPWG